MDPKTIEQLVERHGAALRLYAIGWCRCPDDVVQTAFIKLAVENPTPENPVGWLYRVVRNTAVSWQRTERRRRHHESVVAAGQSWFATEQIGEVDPVELTDALRELDDSQREVVVA